MAESRITKKSLYSWVFHGGNLKFHILLLAIIGVTIFLRVYPLELQKKIINEAIGMKKVDLLITYSLLYVAAVSFATGLKYVINLLQNYVGERTLQTIRQKLYEHLLALPLSYYRRTSPGLVINNLVTELIPVSTFIGSAVSVPAVNIGTFFAMAGYMISLSPSLALVCLAVYPVEIMVIPLLQRKFNAWNRKRINNNQRLSGLIGEGVGGIQEVHTNGSIPLEARKFSKAVHSLYHSTLIMNAFRFGIKVTNNFFQNLGPFILFLYGGWLAINGQFDLGALVAFLSAFEKVYDPWKELMEFWQVYQDSSTRYKQVMSSFDLEPEFAFVPEGRDPYIMDGNIDVQDVSFVVGDGVKLLDRVNLQVKHGEHVALVGFSGSGKSTLALVIAQLYKYTAGNVKIDGREVKDLTKRDMVYNLSMVAQAPFIFSGTIRENLLYSCESMAMQGRECGNGRQIDLDKLIEVSQQVGLFVDVLRFGLRSRIDPDQHPELVEAIIHARQNFQRDFRDELADDIEFFERDKYLEYGSVALNIVFGAPNVKEASLDELYDNEKFRAFLRELELVEPLTALGATVARRTVQVLGREELDPDLFLDTPVLRREYAEVIRVVDEMENDHELEERDERLLLKIALDFSPGLHRIAGISDDFRARMLAARERFIEEVELKASGIFSIFEPDTFLASQSLQENILFGRVKTSNSRAEERINQSIMQLLILEGVLEQVVEMGFEFEVGSQGDNLSGGQRQKTALARTFLKNPTIMVLDEATSALDNASQARIQNLLDSKWKGRSTVLAVIHRLDLLKHYDKVVVMKTGRIVEYGGYEELLDKKGALYELVRGKK